MGHFLRLFPKTSMTDELFHTYETVLGRSATFRVALQALEAYALENDSSYATPAGMRSRVDRMNGQLNIQRSGLPSVGDKRRREIHDAKLKLIQAKASPADDPSWDDDTPPRRESFDLGAWLEHQDDETKRRAKKVAPRLKSLAKVEVEWE